MKKRILSVILSVCLMISLLAVAPLAAFADVTPIVAKSLATTEMVIGAANNEGVSYDINSYAASGNLYFFLPATADLSKLTVTFSDGSSKTVDMSDSVDTPVYFRLSGRNYRVIAMQSGIPAIYIQLDETQGTIAAMNGDSKHETKCFGEMKIDIPEEIAEANDWKTSYSSADIEIKGRGNETWTHPKKPYQFKLNDGKQNIMGMGKAKTWLLLSNYGDHSLIRNALAYYMDGAIGTEFWTQYQFVDFYMNGEYLGSYLLTEKVEINGNRVDITDLEDANEAYDDAIKAGETPDPVDKTGGYLLEYDFRGAQEIVFFRTQKTNQYVVAKSPETATPEQKAYIQDYVLRLEEAIYAANGTNSKGEYYADLLDLVSLDRLYWVQETFKNGDYGEGSIYMYKDVDEIDPIMHMGPVWDMDITVANATGVGSPAGIKNNDMRNNARSPQNWFLRWSGAMPESFIWQTFQHDDFKALNLEFYFSNVRDVLLSLEDLAYEYADYIKESADMNFIRWDILRSQKWDTPNTATTFEGNVEFVANFLGDRAEWIDNAMITEARASAASSLVTFQDYDGTVLKMEVVENGGAATAPADPEREGYDFAGWDVAFDNVTTDLTVTALYTIKTYTVDFVDWDDDVLDSQTVDHGAAAVAPENPERADYLFVGWDVAFDCVTSDLTVKAQYVPATYTVVFEDWDGEVLDSQIVGYGEDAVAPATPERDGYNFLRWKGTFTNVKENLTITAVYSKIVTEVSLAVSANGGYVHISYSGAENYNLRTGATKVYPYGDTVTLKADDRNGAYRFLYWTNANGTILSTDTTYSFTLLSKSTVKAVFAENDIGVYFVSFVDLSKAVVQSEWAEAGALVTPPAESALGSYYGQVFDGWDSDAYQNVQDNLIVNASYIVDPSIRYTVTADSAAATVEPSQEGNNAFAYLEVATVSVDTSKLADGTYFKGWSLDGETIVSYAPTYKFIVTGNVTVYLITTDDPNFVRPAVVTLAGAEYEESGATRLSLTSNYEVPNVYTMVEIGIVFTRQAQYSDQLLVENVDGTNVRKSSSTTGLPFTGACNMTASTTQDMYARGYVTYRTAGGDLETVYSDMYSYLIG